MDTASPPRSHLSLPASRTEQYWPNSASHLPLDSVVVHFTGMIKSVPKEPLSFSPQAPSRVVSSDQNLGLFVAHLSNSRSVLPLAREHRWHLSTRRRQARPKGNAPLCGLQEHTVACVESWILSLQIRRNARRKLRRQSTHRSVGTQDAECHLTGGTAALTPWGCATKEKGHLCVRRSCSYF